MPLTVTRGNPRRVPSIDPSFIEAPQPRPASTGPPENFTLSRQLKTTDTRPFVNQSGATASNRLRCKQISAIGSLDVRWLPPAPGISIASRYLGFLSGPPSNENLRTNMEIARISSWEAVVFPGVDLLCRLSMQIDMNRFVEGGFGVFGTVC